MASLLSNALVKSAGLKGGLLSVLSINTCAVNNAVFIRGMSFFNNTSSNEIWDSMTSVSNTGRKRGRASKGRLMRRVNIYKGKTFSPLTAAEAIKQRIAGEEREAEKMDDRSKSSSEKFKKASFKLNPLDRGYVGRSIQGRRVGVPKNRDGYDFDERGFQSICVQMKYVARMSKTHKNVRRTRALVVLGNGNGLAGYALGKATLPNNAIQIAKQKAALRLTYLERFNDRTLWHNFYEEYHRTKVFAFRKHEGYGLVCHNVIKSICQMFGIKDIYVKVEGETKNYLSITSAFYNGIMKQKTHQEMADELGQNIVEFNSAYDNFPRVVAKPTSVSKPVAPLQKDMGFDYENYFMGGKVWHQRTSKPFYWKEESYKKRKFREYRFRNQANAKLMRVAYGLEKEPKRF